MNIKCKCDICQSRDARYDAKHIVYGYWGYMCPQCYKSYGSKIKGLFTIINEDVPDIVNETKSLSDSQFRLIAQAFGVNEDESDWNELRSHLESNQEALSQAVRYAINQWGNCTPLPADKRGWVVYNERLSTLRELL